ncbi:MAG TPA: hypothetical protein PLP75_11070 [Burkholderiales bacterium]|jgi:hypothetical protein|nr:hypothetical protein [Burkholderiales bacterium]
MDLLETAKQKLEYALSTLEKSDDYTQNIKLVLAALDDGLQFTKKHYSELNSLTMAKTNSLKGSDIYFFFMRFTHQFFNVMNIIQTLPNAGYYEKFLFLLEARQERFDELRLDAISKAKEIISK